MNQYERVFYKHCRNLVDKKHVIVAGDLNVCHTTLDYHIPKIHVKNSTTPSTTKKEQSNFSSFLKMGFIDTFRKLNPMVKKYSWYNVQRLGKEKNLGKRLDYFVVND